MSPRPRCFFVMPFADRWHYFYLYLKKHIEATYAMDVERGDTQRLTLPVAQKIAGQIQRARLVIADLSGANPNVMYEVGVAHALKKPVIFLSQDAPEAAPFDVRHFDFITYRLGDDDGLLRHLDQALQAELAEHFGDLYERACALLEELNRTRGTGLAEVSRDVFHQRIGALLNSQRLPRDDDEPGVAEVLLPRIVRDSTDMKAIRAITAWMDERFTEGT
jgi:hypothetical protein